MLVPCRVRAEADPYQPGDTWQSRYKTGHVSDECWTFTFDAYCTFAYSDDVTSNGLIITYHGSISSISVPIGGGFYGVSDSHTSTPVNVSNTPRVRPLDYSEAGSFTWTLTVDVEEVFETVAVSGSTTIDGSDFPNFGGTAQADGLSSRGVRVYERPLVGGTYTATMTGEGLTCTCTGTILSGFPVPTYDTSRSISCDAYRDSGTYSATDYQSTGSGPVYIGSISDSFADTNGTTSATCSFGASTSVAISDSSTYSTSNPHTSTAAQQGSLGIAVGVKGSLRCFGDAYGSTLNLAVQTGTLSNTLALSPTGSATYTMRNQSWGGSPAGIAHTGGTVDERGKVRAYLTGLGAAGEDSRDWRTMWLGFKRNVLTVSHAANYTLDACSATTQWTGTGCTLSVSSGIRAVSGGSAGSMTWAIASEISSEAYRYLRLRLKADTARTINVTVGGHVWSVSVTTTATDYDIDLCFPLDEGGTVFSKDTRNLIRGPADTPADGLAVTQYEWGWGVNRLDSVAIEVPAGATITTSTCELRRKDHARVSLLAPFVYWPQVWTSPTDTTTGQPYWISETDDRGPADFRQATHVVPSVGASSYAWESQTDLKNWINTIKGFTASLAADHSDGYHTSSLPMMLIGGGGATYDFGSTAWTYWVDQTVTSATIPSQDLWDEVELYDGAGEVFSGGAWNVATPLVTCKYLRGQAWGNVGKPDGTAYASASIVAYITSSPTSTVGTATTGTRGEYRTGSPYGHGNVDCTTELHQGAPAYLSDHETWRNRYRAWTSFRKSAVLSGPSWHTQDKKGRLHHATIVSGDVVYRRAQFVTSERGYFDDSTVTAFGDVVDARMCVDESRALVLMAVTRYNSSTYKLYLLTSTSDGKDFDTGTLMATNSFGGSPWTSDDGTAGLTWFEYNSGTSGPGVQKAKFRKRGSNTFGSTFTFKDSTSTNIAVADGGWANVMQARDWQGRLTWTPIIDGETTPSVWYSTDDGKTWTRSS